MERGHAPRFAPGVPASQWSRALRTRVAGSLLRWSWNLIVALTHQSGPDLAHSQRMVEEHGHDRTGAQQESPAEREAKKNPAEKQDLEKPSEGRDEPPAETVENGKRSPDSPWMGGG